MGGIIYSLIARGTIVLVEHATREGNFVTLANRILTKVPAEDHRKSEPIFNMIPFLPFFKQ